MSRTLQGESAQLLISIHDGQRVTDDAVASCTLEHDGRLDSLLVPHGPQGWRLRAVPRNAWPGAHGEAPGEKENT
jgi:hypothetical protein